MAATRILVIRLGAMGDIIHALPAAATLKHGFPGSRLTWIVNPRWAPLLEGNPFVDEVVHFDRHSLASLRQAWRALRGQRFDLAVDFQGLVQSALVASAARPDRLFGYHQSQVREKPAALFYSSRVHVAAAHVVERNLELAIATGASSMVPSFPLPPGRPEGDLPGTEYVLACPLAGFGSKQWPLENYREIARRLRNELGIPLVLNGPPAAADSLEAVPEAARNYSGLPGLIYATRNALAVLGVDSGPMHLAAALGKPGVALFGPTDPARNGPYGDSFSVLRGADAVTSYRHRAEIDRSMLAITPQAVFEELKMRIHALRRAGSSA